MRDDALNHGINNFLETHQTSFEILKSPECEHDFEGESESISFPIKFNFKPYDFKDLDYKIISSLHGDDVLDGVSGDRQAKSLKDTDNLTEGVAQNAQSAFDNCSILPVDRLTQRADNSETCTNMPKKKLLYDNENGGLLAREEEEHQRRFSTV